VLTLLVVSIGLVALSGGPALMTRGPAGEQSSTALVLLGAAGGLTSAVMTMASGRTASAAVRWQLPNALIALRLDPLAAAFLVPIFVLGAMASVYGLAYWPAHHQASAGRLRAFTGLLLAGMATVVIAAQGMLFLVAWETMALAAFFLIATDDTDAEVRRAAWLYLIATHIGTLVLFALFTLLRSVRGTFLLGPVPATTGAVTSSTILLLALAGFGFKAGLVPLHFWLPGAHANAPSHVSALLSGAMLKVGVYGIIRILLFLPHPPVWWGGLVVVLGLTSALVAISLAIGQADMKRALAYSSIENVGIIMVAVGLSVIGRAAGVPVLAALGLAAAIAHVWNHSLFKGLLFLCAGSVLHATGTRRIDKLGGLLHRMPFTGMVFVIGAAAAAALPGANAFVSEWLLYVGLLRVGLIPEAPRGSITMLAAAVIALAGALAVACFVRLAAALFLGSARSDAATKAEEAPLLMRVPQAVLALACMALGMFPATIAGALETITGAAGTIAPLLRALAMPLQAAAVATAVGVVSLLAATRRSPRRLTWDCGYARPTPRMQYTAGGLSEWLTSRLLPQFLRPAFRLSAPAALYPTTATLSIDVDEPFADRILEPLAEWWTVRAMRLRWLQQGRLPLYLLYIFVTLIAGVVWVVAFPHFGAGR
jgi:hydrogenase-4 component B